MDRPEDGVNGVDIVRRIAIGADRARSGQKETLKHLLETLGYRTSDVSTGADTTETAIAVCRKVVSGDCERGILLDESGIGSSIAANKIKGIRAAACWDLRTAIDSREHEDANVLVLGGTMHGVDDLCLMAKAWLEARFSGGGYMIHVNKINAIERGGFGE
jgi:ribose 5-phosphate isomerase B